jgi:hypothetical protein
VAVPRLADARVRRALDPPARSHGQKKSSKTPPGSNAIRSPQPPIDDDGWEESVEGDGLLLPPRSSIARQLIEQWLTGRPDLGPANKSMAAPRRKRGWQTSPESLANAYVGPLAITELAGAGIGADDS